MCSEHFVCCTVCATSLRLQHRSHSRTDKGILIVKTPALSLPRTQDSAAGMAQMVKRLGLLSASPGGAASQPSSHAPPSGHYELPHLHRNEVDGAARGREQAVKLRSSPPSPAPSRLLPKPVTSSHDKRNSRVVSTTSSPRDHLLQLLARECRHRGKPQNASEAPRALVHACEDSASIVEALSAAYTDDLRLLPYASAGGSD